MNHHHRRLTLIGAGLLSVLAIALGGVGLTAAVHSSGSAGALIAPQRNCDETPPYCN